jgi:glyoxylase-like metal-dependent hydrolase (beta-lactamase superfamily II)
MQILQNLQAFIWTDPAANNCNTYLIQADKTVLIDPGHEHLFGHVSEGLQALSLGLAEIDLVVLTHCHPDHMEAVKVFTDTTTLIAAHDAEVDFFRQAAPHYGEILGVPEFEPPLLLTEGDLNIGGLNLNVIHTPGHSPGSICLYWAEKKVLLTGDLVFNQGVGRTDLPGGDGETLKTSIGKIARLDTEYLLPGHGDIIQGKELVEANFKDIESFWFAYI